MYDWPSSMMWLLMLGTLRALYDLSKPADDPGEPVAAAPFSGLSPQRREWAERSVAGYMRQQEKKWRRWDEAMFKARSPRGS